MAVFALNHQVQFGHAGACANQASETAVAKNKALKEAGAFVPKSFDELGDIIKSEDFLCLFSDSVSVFF